MIAKHLKIVFCCLIVLKCAACVQMDCVTNDPACNPLAAFLRPRTAVTPAAVNAPCSGPGLNLPSFYSYFASGTSTYGYDLCALKDGGLVLAGRTDGPSNLQGLSPLIPYSGGIQDSLIVKWDAAGNVAWFTYLGSATANITVAKITETGDGGVVLVGGISNPDSFTLGGVSPILPATVGDEGDIFVARLGSDGSVLWHTALGGGGAEYDGKAIVVTDDGSIYVAGTAGAGGVAGMGSVSASVPFTAGDNRNVLLAKFSSAGELTSFRYIGGGGTGAEYNARALIQTADGSLVISGDAAMSPANTIDGIPAILPFTAGDNRDMMALKVSPGGNLQWLTYFGGCSAGATYWNIGAAAMSDGSAVISGDVGSACVSTIGGLSALIPYDTGSGNSVVLKLNSDGALQWFSFLGGSTGSLSVAASSDDGLIAAGNSQGGGNTLGTVNALSPYQPSVGVAARFAKFSATGNLEWFTYASDGVNAQYYIQGLVGVSGGGLIAAGYAREGADTMQGKTALQPYDTGASENFFVMKIDSQGRL